MKQISNLLILLLFVTSCSSQKKLAYLDNLPEPSGEESFPIEFPNYRIKPRDILFITVKAMTPEGRIADFLSTGTTNTSTQDESGGYLYGYSVNLDGNIRVPVIGTLKVEGLTLEDARNMIQDSVNKVFKNTTVDCKLQSFKFTVIGEVVNPGTYINYNNYLTVLEAIGRAGGVGNFGDRSKILVVRPVDKGTKTFKLNLQDKNLLASEAYFLFPNDVVIIQPLGQKIFNLNLPTISFIISTVTSTITMTLLLINYFAE
jgi:polysaccharide biosynthesis/export protein